MKHGDLTVESSRRLHRRPAKSLGAENRSGICGGDGQMSGQASSYVPTASSACLPDQWSGVGGRSVGRGGSADDDAGAAAAAARNK